MLPLESVATPAASPRWMFGGQLQKVDIPVEGNLRNLGARAGRADSRQAVAQKNFIVHGSLYFPFGCRISFCARHNWISEM